MRIQKYVGASQIDPTKAATFTRLAKCIAAGSSRADQLDAAERQRAADPVVKIIKAAQPATLTTDAGWQSADGVFGSASAEFIASVGPASIFYTLAGMSREFPLQTRVIAAATSPNAKPVADGQALPVTRADLDQFMLSPKLSGSIIVASDELLASSDGAAFAFLREEMQVAAIAAVDEVAMDTALTGITPVTATASPLVDLRGMLGTVNTNGSGSLMFAMSADVANVLSTMPRDFPELSPRGGLILNVPALVSDAVPDGRVILIDSLGFAVNQGLITVDRSNAAALQLNDAPTMDSATPTPAEVVSLFGANLTAIRVLARIGIERIRDSAVAAVDGAASAWGA
jgi:HK97 family phage major capsid protein